MLGMLSRKKKKQQYIKERQYIKEIQNIKEQQIKKEQKKRSILLAVLFIILMVCFCAACEKFSTGDKSSSKITELKLFRHDSVELDAGKTTSGYFSVEGNKKFRLEDVEFISLFPEIATIEYYFTSLTTHIYYKITAVSPGITTVYAQTKDGEIKTEEIAVTVKEVVDVISSEPEVLSQPVSSSETPVSSKAAENSKEVSSKNSVSSKSDVSSTATSSKAAESTPPAHVIVPEGNSPTVAPPNFTNLITNVRRNEVVSITVQGQPNTEYNLSVVYASGHVSEAGGLGKAMSDANGAVSWSWKIGGRTGFGKAKFIVTGAGQTNSYEFEVVEG